MRDPHGDAKQRELVEAESASELAKKAVTFGTASSGGYAVPAGWIGEGGSPTETTTSDLVEVAPTFGTIYTRPKASEEAVADIFFDVGKWLVSEVADSFSAAEATAIWSGTGSNRSSGLNNTTPVSTADNASPERAATALQYRPIAGAASPLVLNAVLRLGIPRNASLRWRLEAAGMLKNFAETQERAWTARVDLIRRVGNFLEEFAALAPRVMLRGSEAALELRYDETGLQINLSWQGKPLHLDGSLNTDDDGTLHVALMRHWADAISQSGDSGRQTLRVYVDER